MPATNGNPDSFFIGRVRRILRDNGVSTPDKFPSDGTTGTFIVAGAKPFKANRPPLLPALPCVITAPGGNYQGVLNSYLPVFDAVASTATRPPVIVDGGAGGTLPAGDYQVFWTLGVGNVAGDTPGSLPSALSNKVTIVANHLITITNLPAPIPASGINVYIIWQAVGTPPPNAWGFALFIAAAAAGPYNISAPGDGVSPAFITSDTGEITFGVAPPTGTLAITYGSARFSDAQILDALHEGMNLLWPEIWNPQTNTTQIGVSPTQFEYPLMAALQDQRAMILDVEYSPPSGFIRYYRTSLWRQLEDINNPTLIFSELPPVSSIVRLTFTVPFVNLADVPTEASHLPIYYANARLMADQEVMRARADDIPAQTQENVGPPGTSLSVATFWLERFNEQLQKLALDAPARRTIADRAVEALGLSEFWTHVA